ncbi:unnamed protein product [Brassicogethes aeneus]|uniref:Protein suppressor of white apricot n=1 Tax=Brassicogethes aeneus TaxID=1431903 RepID=A0A9P0FCX8_BRAAE|nr:unnamed protein product [Brassicogethes aeneus]
MAQWNNDTGILRKNKPKENHEELLVFGYACKLFRDDERAQHIDQGKHLIPWMGDEKLKIDRYDCRGALSDLKRYEASREGFDARRWLGLSDSDRKLEELCDKERYYSLLINEEEEEMYKEEEAKRQKTNAIQYSYDVPMEPKSQDVPNVPEEEEEYVPLPSLDVPVDINIPKTVKEYARIEKTAKFVCKQGLQMEILIKAKQADNPQFGFLNQGDSLYKFYRHVCSAFKSGRYEGMTHKTEEKEESQGDSGGHYLHPSLIASKTQPEPPLPAPPAIPYKPSANCAYSQLVNRIQGNDPATAPPLPPAAAADQKPSAQMQSFAQLPYEQQQYYQYYYTSQYYEYYKQLAQYQQTCGENSGQTVSPPDFQLDPSMQSYFQQLAYTQYMQHHQQQQQQQQNSNNSYAQIVSNVNKDNPYSASVPTLPPNVVKSSEPIEVKVEPATAEVVLKKPLLSLAAYGSDSEEDDEAEVKEKETFTIPGGETQIVIDKMAAYVSKNGEQFEDIVKAKGDPRFEFLNDSHEHNKYYRSKIRELKGETVVKEVKVEKVTEEDKNEDKEKEKPVVVKEEKEKEKEKKKVIAPVCFSIKKPKEEPAKEIKSALPVEESDDEEEQQEKEETPPQIDVEKPTEDKPQVTEETLETPQCKNGIIDVDDPILEMIDLTFDAEDRRDAKRAEDRIKDKIASAAREKLASATKDKALQMERKKKAALFLKMKSAQISEENKPTQTAEKDKKVEQKSSDKEKRSMDKPRKSSDRDKRRTEEKSRSREKERKGRSPKKDPNVIVEGESEDCKRRKSLKKKKSHKRKRSKSKSRKKSKRKHKRSSSCSSDSS